MAISRGVKTLGMGKKGFGRVVYEWPPGGHRVGRFVEEEPFISCWRHWVEGRSWEETSVYERMEEALKARGKVDGCINMDDVTARYEELDAIFETVRKTNRIVPCPDYDSWCFRELGGIVFHVGPDGECFFGKIGQHRLAIAIILGIPRIPAALGAVYRGSLPVLHELRWGNQALER